MLLMIPRQGLPPAFPGAVDSTKKYRNLRDRILFGGKKKKNSSESHLIKGKMVKTLLIDW